LPSLNEDRRIRSLRPPKPTVDAWKAHGTVIDVERRPDGAVERALTVFLSGAECPFTCSFCDLWRYTIDGSTPQGALPAQIDDALGGLTAPLPTRIKLYNASNFFDRRAVPTEDLPRIAEQCNVFSAVTVESHVNTIGDETLAFAGRLSGRLEVAIGFETAQPVALEKLNKRITRQKFEAAVAFLREHDIDVRVFVLLGAPHIQADASLDWTLRTVQAAAEAGANVIAIIPVRGGNGEMDRLRSTGEFTPPTLAQLEQALERSLPRHDCVVTVDLWDARRLQTCAACRESRIERLRRMNLSQRVEPKSQCAECGGA
jgi:radical SAM enzyme (TIGR01210 family)